MHNLVLDSHEITKSFLIWYVEKCVGGIEITVIKYGLCYFVILLYLELHLNCILYLELLSSTKWLSSVTSAALCIKVLQPRISITFYYFQKTSVKLVSRENTESTELQDEFLWNAHLKTTWNKSFLFLWSPSHYGQHFLLAWVCADKAIQQ